jgi:hypothetical protein
MWHPATKNNNQFQGRARGEATRQRCGQEHERRLHPLLRLSPFLSPLLLQNNVIQRRYRPEQKVT